MSDFISGFFTWVKLDKELIDALPDKEEPIEVREDNFNPLDMIIKKDEEE
tara:strand:+ start:261 stop:410 length:150 start_codon:yes stop_codon:yes gene_type:complete